MNKGSNKGSVNINERERASEEQRQREEEKLLRKKAEREEQERKKQENYEKAEEASKKLAKKKSGGINSYYIVIGVVVGLCLYICVMLFMNQQAPLNKTATIDDKRIDEHNHNFPWKQGANKFFEGSTLADAKKIINTSFASHSNLIRCNVDDSIVPPETFDSRREWPNCVSPTGNQQRTCGSSYAFAVASATAERLCIASKEQKLPSLSPQELISCDVNNQGCKGGYLNNALDYIKTKGISTETCFPYQADSETVKCDKMCANPQKERIDGYCILFGEDDIKRDIVKNGPVVATSQVHTDFLPYKSGVYQKGDEVPRFSGFSAIKIVGWGVEDGRDGEPNKGNKYWIVQNSWGDDWGENGYARISMGQELMFDQYSYSIKVRTDKVEPKSQTQQTASKSETDNADLVDESLDLDSGSA